MGREFIPEQIEKARQVIMNRLTISKYLEDMHLNDGKTLQDIDKVRCPVHNDSTPSFHFDNEKKTCHCFGCHLKGGVIEIHVGVSRSKDSSYNQVKAILELSKKYNIEIPDLFQHTIEQEKIEAFRTSSKRKRGVSSGEEAEWFYMDKLKDLEGKYNHLPFKERVQVSTAIDNVWLGLKDAKDIYFKIRKIINAENQRLIMIEMEKEGIKFD